MRGNCNLCYHPHGDHKCEWPVDDAQDQYTVPCGCPGEDVPRVTDAERAEALRVREDIE